MISNGRIASDGRSASCDGGDPMGVAGAGGSASAAAMAGAASAAEAPKRSTNAVKLAMENYQSDNQQATTVTPAANTGIPAQRPAKKAKKGCLARPGHAPLLPQWAQMLAYSVSLRAFHR